MLNAYEQRLMAFYLANAAAALHHRDREASDLAEWIADRENRVAFGRRKRPSPIRSRGSVVATRGCPGATGARSRPPCARSTRSRGRHALTGPRSGSAVSRRQRDSRAGTSTSSSSSFATRRSPSSNR